MQDNIKATNRTCIVYLHAHGSNRTEGYHLLKICVENDLDLCLFDFGGSGNSEGDYVTLGMQESRDCKVLLEVLKEGFEVKRFILWGRSMGAVAAILSV